MASLEPFETVVFEKLSDLGLLTTQKIGKSNYYINHGLFELLSDVSI